MWLYFYWDRCRDHRPIICRTQRKLHKTTGGDTEHTRARAHLLATTNVRKYTVQYVESYEWNRSFSAARIAKWPGTVNCLYVCRLSWCLCARSVSVLCCRVWLTNFTNALATPTSVQISFRLSLSTRSTSLV